MIATLLPETTMTIEFACPTCQTHIRVDDAAAGKMARCPKCQGICRVPESSSPPPGSGDLLSGANPPKPFGASDPQSNSATSTPSQINPFGDVGQVGGGAGAPLNPYASPAYASSPVDMGPLLPEEVRMKLLGPAIGIVIGGVLCLGYAGLTLIGMLVNVNQPFPADDAGRMFLYVWMAVVVFAMTLPSLAMLFGSVAMFRGKGLPLAWTGAIAAVMPCNPCCLISLGFGIWGIVVLCDPRVAQAMRN